MNKHRFISLLVTLLVLLVSCETDFDITADWKDITVVYGLIDQKDSVHYIKINKAFLGPGNALEYASIEDSSSYGGNLEVKLVENRNASSRDIIFDTTSVYQKESGLFYYPHQVLYKSNAQLYENGDYTLKIRNKTTGKEISASTSVIYDFNIEKPRPNTPNSNTFDFRRTVTTEQEFSWISAKNGKRYQITVRFFFKESSSPGDTVVRSVEWLQSPVKSENITGGEQMTSSYLNEQFFTTCINRIPYVDPATEANVNTRQVLRLDFIFTVIGDVMNTYLEVNEPSSGVLQDKPEYTNITNGIGVFSCRSSKTRSKNVGEFTELNLIAIENLKFIKNPDN